jgi:hypothetical protein
MKFSVMAAAVLAMIAPLAAHAGTTADFNGACANTASATQAACTNLNGSYGNTATLTSTNDPTLQVKISAWQANQATTGPNANQITSAFLGSYSGGFGVTGLGDNNGASNLHQIDNLGGYTDFIVLQFSSAVHLDGINANVYGINNVYDSDVSFRNGTAFTPNSWNGSLNLGAFNASQFSTVAADGNSGYRANSVSGFSQVWLVAASVATTDRDDGFKLASITVTRQTPAVPEPATWAMMILGFGFVGASLRRKAAATAIA